MKTKIHKGILILMLLAAMNIAHAADAPGRWPEEKSNAWLKENGWLRGSNFMPSSAINQIEMWQAATFNSMRVFLHDLCWLQDHEGYTRRINCYLELADKHHIKTLFVIFDSCWYPLPYLGAQMAPLPYTHNSGWVQSPGVSALQAEGEYPRLHAYVTGLVRAFANDKRICGWDVWNEPDNGDGGAPGRPDLEPKNKMDLVAALLPQVFAWAREGNPSQPLTSGVWLGDWSSDEKLAPIPRTQLKNSDVISFHNYSDLAGLQGAVDTLRRFNRPMLCTEYMARPIGSTFAPHLGWMKENNVAAYNWGFVSGKSQTIYPWDSWKTNYTSEPPVWFHDILRLDGTPYKQEEADYIKSVTGKAK